MRLHLGASPTLVVFELASCGIERLSDRNVDVVGLGLPLDRDLLPRHGQTDADTVHGPLPVMPVGRLEPDLAVLDSIGETRESIGPRFDLRGDRLQTGAVHEVDPHGPHVTLLLFQDERDLGVDPVTADVLPFDSRLEILDIDRPDVFQSLRRLLDRLRGSVFPTPLRFGDYLGSL
jgi:hypothetical protein